MTTPQDAPAKANTAVKHGDFDRVSMLSLHADGSPAQTPQVELIGDKDAVLDATKEQFRQQAVSTVDTQLRREQDEARSEVSDKEDPDVAKLTKAHETAEKAAESAAEKTVKALHQGDEG